MHGYCLNSFKNLAFELNCLFFEVFLSLFFLIKKGRKNQAKIMLPPRSVQSWNRIGKVGQAPFPSILTIEHSRLRRPAILAGQRTFSPENNHTLIITENIFVFFSRPYVVTRKEKTPRLQRMLFLL